MSTESDAPDDTRAPRTIATEARDQALQDFQQVAQLDDVVEQAQQAQEAAQEFTDELATAVAKGLSTSQAKSFCGMVADASDNYTKTALVELLEEAVEEKKTEESGRRPFDKVVREDLNEVVISRTTDAKQATKYRWEFEEGSVETTATAEGREHFHWNNFRDEYFDATGEDPAKPVKHLRDPEDWREFIVEQIDAHGREQATKGPRSAAVDDLKSFIRGAKAYTDLEAMVERSGVYLSAAPDEDPDELWVHNHDIQRICDDNSLSTPRELQLELDARGYTVERVQGVSETTTVNYNKVTYWVLTPDIAEPAEYVADPSDPAEQIEEQPTEDEDDGSDADAAGTDDNGSDDTADDDGGDNDDGGPGLMGATGGDAG